MFADFSEREAIKPYMPPVTGKKQKQLDRTYFFTICNSFFEEEIGTIIEHASG